MTAIGEAAPTSGSAKSGVPPSSQGSQRSKRPARAWSATNEKAGVWNVKASQICTLAPVINSRLLIRKTAINNDAAKSHPDTLNRLEPTCCPIFCRCGRFVEQHFFGGRYDF